LAFANRINEAGDPQILSGPSRRRFLQGAVTSLVSLPNTVSWATAGSQHADQPISRIAFGSCAQQWKPQPIWNAIAAAKPDLFLFLGDAIYGDWDGTNVFIPTPETLKRDWDRLAANPEFRRLRSTVPVMGTWDNHDYGKHDGGAEYKLKEQSKKLILDFLGEPSDSDRRSRPGIFDAKILGPVGKRVQLILLDTRSFKSPCVKDPRIKAEKSALNIRGQYLPNQANDATLLGAAQWSWLEKQLLHKAEIRLIASSTQVVADEKAMEEWGNFPLERQRLFRLITKTRASGVILLSGNVHFAEISATDEGAYTLYDFTSSGMTHSNPEYAVLKNKRRVAGPYVMPNYGLVSIDWDSKSSPVITIRAVGSEGYAAFEKAIPLAGLEIR